MVKRGWTAHHCPKPGPRGPPPTDHPRGRDPETEERPTPPGMPVRTTLPSGDPLGSLSLGSQSLSRSLSLPPVLPRWSLHRGFDRHEILRMVQGSCIGRNGVEGGGTRGLGGSRQSRFPVRPRTCWWPVVAYWYHCQSGDTEKRHYMPLRGSEGGNESLRTSWRYQNRRRAAHGGLSALGLSIRALFKIP